MSEVIDLTEAQYHQGYQLRLQFSDGSLVDFESEDQSILRFRAMESSGSSNFRSLMGT